MGPDGRLILADGTEPILSPDGQIITGLGGVYQFTDGDGTIYILGGPSEERQNEHRECVADLRAALEEIVNDDLDTYRKMLFGRSVSEIAEEFELPVAMVAQMRAEAMQELRAEIARQREARTTRTTRSTAPPRHRVRPTLVRVGRRESHRLQAGHKRVTKRSSARSGDSGDEGPAEPAGPQPSARPLEPEGTRA